jgi:SAM-dependent methyltransferase
MSATLIGLSGVAVLRSLANGDEQRARQVARTLIEVLQQPQVACCDDTPVLEAKAGYEEWAPTFERDSSRSDNFTALIEQSEVRNLILGLPVGRTLDAGCGTGRYAAFLAELGHAVTGLDASPAMVEQARANVPGATFLTGDVMALPVESARFDAVVHSLVMSHVADLAAAVAEIARVLKPGGRAVISAPHPIATEVLGLRPSFERQDGSRAKIVESTYWHAEYLASFEAAGLHVRSCREPKFQPPAPPDGAPPDLLAGALTGLPVFLIWELERANERSAHHAAERDN